MTAHTDPITAEVVARHMLSVAEEMGVTLLRTAFSPNIKERGDCSTAIFDAAGRVVAQAHHVPIHLGSMIGAIDSIRRRYPDAEIRPGDMFLANDPYSGGGSHLPDINIVAPVFEGGRLVAFVANIAHHADVGGMVPGSEAAVCQNIYQEGLRIPVVKVMSEGRRAQDIIDVILLNSRTPEERIGDLNAQIAANHWGIRGMQALAGRYGADRLDAAIAAYLDHTGRRFDTAIRGLPEGCYTAEDFLTGDAPGSLARIRLALTVRDGELRFDFDGTDPQLGSARNIPHQALMATIYTVAKALLDPDVPANDGCFRGIRVSAPSGCLVQPTPPAAVGCRAISCGVLSDVICAALSQAMPEKALAGSGPHHLLVLSGTDPRTGAYFVNYETVAGGLGARPDTDGMDAVRTLAAGSANLPIEALEHAYPLRVERYALRPASDGAGRYRGGVGIVRDYRILGDDIAVSLSAERQQAVARGLHGGGGGAAGAFILDPDSDWPRPLGAAESDIALPRGSVLRVCTPGGAGYGPAGERDPAGTARELREDRIDAETARTVYGYSDEA